MKGSVPEAARTVHMDATLFTPCSCSPWSPASLEAGSSSTTTHYALFAAEFLPGAASSVKTPSAPEYTVRGQRLDAPLSWCTVQAAAANPAAGAAASTAELQLP
jgi:hypothetical protein